MLALLAIILLMIITYLIFLFMSVMIVHMAASLLLYSGKLANLCTLYLVPCTFPSMMMMT